MTLILFPFLLCAVFSKTFLVRCLLSGPSLTSHLDLCNSALVYCFPFQILKSTARHRAAAPDSASLPLNVQPSTCLLAGTPKQTNLLKSDTTPAELVKRYVSRLSARAFATSPIIEPGSTHLSRHCLGEHTPSSKMVRRLPPPPPVPCNSAAHVTKLWEPIKVTY